MGAVVVRQEGTLVNAKELDEREEKEKGRGKSYEIGERIPVEVCVGPHPPLHCKG